MAISSKLSVAILSGLKISPPTLTRRAQALMRDHGPMSADEARWVIAHEANLDLRKFGLSSEQLDRVRQLRAAIGRQPAEGARTERLSARDSGETSHREPAQAAPPSRSMIFNSRRAHILVEKASRKLFVDGHPTDAIGRAFQSVNNRVRKLSGLKDDGQKLMSGAFSDAAPRLQMSALRNVTEKDEHAGLRFLMMGGVAALRNPRAHEDNWEPDEDVDAVLDALSLASLLHRFLDRCEQFAATNGAGS